MRDEDLPDDYMPDDDGMVAAMAMIRGLAPKPTLTVSEWADANRRLTKGAEQGPWSTARAPYLREPMDFFSATSAVGSSAHDVPRKLCVMKGSQLGFSEMLLNVIGYSVAHDPKTILMVLPTVEIAEDFSKERIAPMLESSGLVDPTTLKARTTDSTILKKQGPGWGLFLAGSNSPRTMASRACALVLGDERDGWAESAGSEGDPGKIAEMRLQTYGDAGALGIVSTPGVRGFSPIEKAYEASDQRVFEVPCPHCGAFQVLRLQAIIRNPETLVGELHCVECGEMISESAKPWMLDRGQWTARRPDVAARGYWISSLYSPWRTWAGILDEFLQVKDDPGTLQVFVNTVLGETWDPHDAGDAAETELMSLREPYEGVPHEAGVITAVADTQIDRLEVLVDAWGPGDERWHLGLFVLYGDTTRPEVWTELDRLLTNPWRHPSGRQLAVMAAGIDTGGLSTQEVYQFCESRQARRVWALKGQSYHGKPLWGKRPTYTEKSGRTPIYGVNVNAGKSTMRQRIAATMRRRKGGEAAGPGMVHWPVADWCDEAYFKQLMAEHETVRVVGSQLVRRWVLPKGRRNEAWDLEVYGWAVLNGLKALGVDLERAALEAQTPPESTEPAKPTAPRQTVGFRPRTPTRFGPR